MKPRAIAGIVLVLLGAYLFLNRGESVGVGTIFATFWPTLFVLPLGLFFHWLYFAVLNRKGVGVLVPGGILITAGLVSQIATLLDGWQFMWPGFILAPAVGLFELYWFGGRNKYLLIPINILTVISLVFFAVFSIGTFLSKVSASQPILAIIVCLIGAFLLVGRKKEF